MLIWACAWSKYKAGTKCTLISGNILAHKCLSGHVLSHSLASDSVTPRTVACQMATQVQSLVWEDSTPRRGRVPQLLKLVCLEPVLCGKRSHVDEKPGHRHEEQPPFPVTTESPLAARKPQHHQKLIILKTEGKKT